MKSPYPLRFLGFLLCLSVCASTYYPCTVAVVSGKVTADGRPLLWKNRDTSNPDNKLVFIKGKAYSFLAVVNSADNAGRHVWQGINNNGFAIMNSLSRDLGSGAQSYAENGSFMRRALEECADVAEFEKLLQATDGERRVAANYGVIDAKGSACFFETGPDSFTKFDANDPRVAPQGYIVRTNYAFTAPEGTEGGGYIRFERISHLFQRAAAENRLSLQFILQEASRDLVNEKIHSNPLALLPTQDPSVPLYIRTNDTINRISTVSASVFHGAPSQEKAYTATMWTILGQPICSVAVPLWVQAGTVPPVLGGEGTSPMNDLSKELLSYLYPDKRANMKQYLNVTRLLTFGGNGFLPRLFAIENEIVKSADLQLEEWNQSKPDQATVAAYAKAVADKAYAAIKESFAEILE